MNTRHFSGNRIFDVILIAFCQKESYADIDHI